MVPREVRDEDEDMPPDIGNEDALIEISYRNGADLHVVRRGRKEVFSHIPLEACGRDLLGGSCLQVGSISHKI